MSPRQFTPFSVSRRRVLACSLAAVVAVVAASTSMAASARAAGTAAWTLSVSQAPTNFVPGQRAKFGIVPFNAGTGASSGTITVTDALPPGLTAMAIAGNGTDTGWTCTLASVSCTSTRAVPAGYSAPPIQLEVEVAAVTPEGERLTDSATISGGSAPVCGGAKQPACASGSDAVLVSSTAATFGIQSFTAGTIAAGGGPYTQAGGHPYAASTSFELNTAGSNDYPSQKVKDVEVTLPAGFVGNPTAVPRCSELLLERQACPSDTQIGVVNIGTSGGFLYNPVLALSDINHGVYNLVPEPGYPAQFGFIGFESYPTMLYAKVRTGHSYEVTIRVPNIIDSHVTGASVTLWGVPADFNGSGEAPKPFLTNPTSCEGEALAPPLTAIEADPWENPSSYVTAPAAVSPAVTGCNLLSFAPSITAAPSAASEGGTTQVDTPTGFTFGLSVPQSEGASELATPELKDATVTLPEGMSVNPSAAQGLTACSEGEINLSSAAAGRCPEASKIATAKITTPLLEEPLPGAVYLAEPECGGSGQPACSEAYAVGRGGPSADGKLFGLYLEAEGSGVVIKVPGTVSANPRTGRLTASFKNNPQLPFSHLELAFKGGPRAPLANPQSCGAATTTSDLTPWSAPFTPDATPISSFQVTGCGASMPFAPGFLAQSSSSAPGDYNTQFALMFSRNDGEQDLEAIQVSMPPGLLGKIAGIRRCAEAQANAGTCSAESQIGTVAVAAGAGNHPYDLPGTVYLTQGYSGAPFGLSIVVPAVAGPFNLGDVVVRAAINVNPATAALTITSGGLPQIIDGVPIRLRSATVDINRADFMVNPTNCAAQSVSATIASAQGATASVSSPFAAGGCKNLPFKPSLSASTRGSSSRKNGASLSVKISQNAGEANIHKVEVQLPIKLSARIYPTLKGACTEAQFAANPAGCPEVSFAGYATAHTPILSQALSGPAIFVSHGAAKFPDLDVILQGEGVSIILTGHTQITKGRTYSRFETVPDAPISSFELNLPESTHSALAPNLPTAAKFSFCGQSLRMPTLITAQNGAVVKQTTKVTVSGCGPALYIKSKQITGKTARLKVLVPSAGTLKASAKGLSHQTMKPGKEKVVSLRLQLTNARSAKLSNGKKLKTKIRLTFTPRGGRTLTKTVKATFKPPKKKTKANASRRAKR